MKTLLKQIRAVIKLTFWNHKFKNIDREVYILTQKNKNDGMEIAWYLFENPDVLKGIKQIEQGEEFLNNLVKVVEQWKEKEEYEPYKNKYELIIQTIKY